MITESKIEHIESLLNRAYQEESGLVRYIPGIFTSMAIFLCGFGITNLLSIWGGIIEINEKNPISKYSIHILVTITIFSIIFIIYSLCITSFKNREYKSFITEIKEIVLKLRGQLNTTK